MHGGAASGPYSPLKCFANIFISFVGAGVLGLPYTFRMAGTVECILIIMLAGSMSAKAMLLLVDCKYEILKRRKKMLNERDENEEVTVFINADQRKRKEEDSLEDTMDYGDVSEFAFGIKGWWLVQISIILSQLGFCCAYLIFIRENLHNLIPKISVNDGLLGCLIPLTFLCNIRDLSELGVFSLLADFANLLAYSVVFWFDYSQVEKNGPQGKAMNFSGVPFALGVAIYCYEGAGLIISLEASVPKEHRKEFPRIFISALTVITCLYIVFGAFGYISFGEETEKIITLNLPSGIFPNVVKACLSFSLFFTYPVMVFPVSGLLEKKLSNGKGLPYVKGTGLRACLVAATGIVVVCIPDFAIIMGLIGSTCCMVLGLIMPALNHLAIFKTKLTRIQIFWDILIILLGCIGSMLGTRDALLRIFSPSEAQDPI
eukprot:m.72225 g.72225  ORF g.72225 m.72225 type:complete len:431 (+) comp12311_c0_seq2:357-1649(+)